jgi:hypothetical protein
MVNIYSNFLGKNKTVFQPLCRDILNVLKTATGVLRIPLTATIWNLSSIRVFPILRFWVSNSVQARIVKS